MTRIEKTLLKMKNSPGNVSFHELVYVCKHYFGEARQKGTSHCVFKMPWSGDPRVNIQCAQHGKAKVYQINQVLKAIKKMEQMK